MTSLPRQYVRNSMRLCEKSAKRKLFRSWQKNIIKAAKKSGCRKHMPGLLEICFISVEDSDEKSKSLTSAEDQIF